MQPDNASQKATVLIAQDQVAALDRLAVIIRLNSGVAIKRAHLINAIIESATKLGSMEVPSNMDEFAGQVALAWEAMRRDGKPVKARRRA